MDLQIYLAVWCLNSPANNLLFYRGNDGEELGNSTVRERGKQGINIEHHIVTVICAEDNAESKVYIQNITNNTELIEENHVGGNIEVTILPEIALTDEATQTGINNTDHTREA